jgi:DHA2 family multidrug resistance protein
MIMAPSGVGTMMTMFLAGRLIGRVELRLLLLTGFMITAVALWEMRGYSLDVSAQKIVWAVTIQGIGLGLVFVPLSTASFSTLPMGMRAQGTAIYSLVRNIGSSIGISMVQTLLVRNTQIVHASLAEKITYSNPAMKDPLISSLLSPGNSVGLALINGDVTRQAAMVAYINDFWLMMLFTVIVLPLLILIRPPKIRRTLETHSAAMD